MSTNAWPSADRPGIAIVAPTGYGTWGIWWSDFPAMERRGGYSGPYRTEAEAVADALDWGKHWDCPVLVECRDTKPGEG